MILHRYLIVRQYLIILAVIAGLTGCDDSEPDTFDKKTLLTAGTWTINTVTVDGVNQDELFTNFTISFTETAFTSTSGGALWPLYGRWAFTDSDQNHFTRDDGIQVTIENISQKELTLTLTWSKTTLGKERTASIQGNYVFTFRK